MSPWTWCLWKLRDSKSASVYNLFERVGAGSWWTLVLMADQSTPDCSCCPTSMAAWFLIGHSVRKVPYWCSKTNARRCECLLHFLAFYHFAHFMSSFFTSSFLSHYSLLKAFPYVCCSSQILVWAVLRVKQILTMKVSLYALSICVPAFFFSLSFSLAPLASIYKYVICICLFFFHIMQQNFSTN